MRALFAEGLPISCKLTKNVYKRNRCWVMRNCFKSSNSKELNEDSSDVTHEPDARPPDPPTNCCMSGCPTCVWLDYADELSQHYTNGYKHAKEAIEKEVTDPNLKAFILFELKIKNK